MLRIAASQQPNVGGRDSIESLKPDALKFATAFVEPSLKVAKCDDIIPVKQRSL